MAETETVGIAVLGGLIPSLIWLVFWLREDRCAPEPKLRILLTFLGGAAVVALVLPLERFIMLYVSGTSLLLYWAVIEEMAKLAAAAALGFWSRAYDEPLDAIIYMVTAALGFAAAENALFLFGPLSSGNLFQVVATGDLRFVGATLLHVLSSATIGLAMAYAFYKHGAARLEALIIGVILAVSLHTLFNFFILQTDAGIVFSVFLSIWAGVIALLFLVERVKHFANDYC